MLTTNRLATAALFITASPAAVLIAGPHMPRASFPRTWVRNMERVDMNMNRAAHIFKTILLRGRGGF